MQKAAKIQYLCAQNAGMELILCTDSAISYPLHNHVSVFTIGLVLCGSISLKVGEHAELCPKGHSFAILPYVPHCIKAQTPYSLLTVCIQKDVLQTCGRDAVEEELRRLLAACAPPLTDAQTVRLFRCLDAWEPLRDAAEPCLDAAKKQMECHPEAKLSIDEMARALYLSKYHFIRSFKRAVGLTPHQFQIQNRIRKAQRMLQKTDCMTEVALTTGFCDQSHFIKYFERYVGLTPTVYQNSCTILTKRAFP